MEEKYIKSGDMQAKNNQRKWLHIDEKNTWFLPSNSWQK